MRCTCAVVCSCGEPPAVAARVERASANVVRPEPLKLSAAGYELLKRHEGLRLEAYRCPAGVLTIGYGHTGDVEDWHRISAHEADVILQYDVEGTEAGVARLTDGLRLTQGQWDALVCFAFNVGLAALSRSTLLRRLRAGDVHGAADELLRWTRGGGKVLPGLVKRRAEERALFLSGVESPRVA